MSDDVKRTAQSGAGWLMHGDSGLPVPDGGVINPAPEQSMAATASVPADHPDILAFALKHAGEGADLERAVRVFYAVRDLIRYDPYKVNLNVETMGGLYALQQGHGWCVTKAALLAACWRAIGIPARLGFADVKNHLSTEKLRKHMGTDVFAWHGYVDAWLQGRWVKATPAFNLSLCEKFGLLPLDFNGLEDSIYHPFDRAGNRHMEYVNERGTFSDLPLQQIRATFVQLYRSADDDDLQQADWEADTQREGAQARSS